MESTHEFIVAGLVFMFGLFFGIFLAILIYTHFAHKTPTDPQIGTAVSTTTVL